MKQAVIYHPGLMQSRTGSAEALLRNFARILSESGEFMVWCWYDSGDVDPVLLEEFFNNQRIKLISFKCDGFKSAPPWAPKFIEPTLSEFIQLVGDFIYIGLVSAGDQWPITSFPSKVPLILISPFGDFCSNGNLRCIYASGMSNVEKLKILKVPSPKILFNPIVVPPENLTRREKNGAKVIFGRVGRSTSYIFDPISILAFAKLESEFGDNVQYIYVNPSVEARELVSRMGLKQVVFLEWLSQDQLSDLYKTFDVFAHARRDGETLGVSIAEAMLHGCAVISHKSAVINEHLFLVRQPYGFVAEVDGVDEYYDAMKYLVLNSKKLPEIGAHARKFAIRYFDWSNVADEILKDCITAYEYIKHPLPLEVRLWHRLLRLSYWYRIARRKLCSLPIF